MLAMKMSDLSLREEKKRVLVHDGHDDDEQPKLLDPENQLRILLSSFYKRHEKEEDDDDVNCVGDVEEEVLGAPFLFDDKRLSSDDIIRNANLLVNAHNASTGDKLFLEEVVAGDQKVVGGLIFKLILKLSDGGGNIRYAQGTLFTIPWTNFTRVNQLTFAEDI